MYELTCPACGAIVESHDREEVILIAGEHTLAAHSYELPREHAIAAIETVGDE